MFNEQRGIPLTCYIRTLNEANRIGTVVEKVREIGADVIVVDSGSSDDTCKVAVDKGARVIRQDWLGHGYQKRVGEQAAINDWLLDLDADEVISDDLQLELVEMFKNGAPLPGVYSLKMVTIPPVPRGVVWRNYSLVWRNKLYHRSIAQMPEHAAWDQLKLPENIKPRKLKGVLYHYSFFDLQQIIQKMNSYSSAMANNSRLKPKGYLALRVFCGFPIYFLKQYLRNRLFLGGVYGFSVAFLNAVGRWQKDAKMFEKHLLKNGRNQIK